MFRSKKHFILLLSSVFLVLFLASGCTKQESGGEANENGNEEASSVNNMEDKYQAIVDLFVQKYNKNPEDVEITFNSENESYVRGDVKMGGAEGEGGIFLAAKNGAVWELVFDGNGSFSCSILDEYGFPSEMKEGCYIPPKFSSIVNQVNWLEYNNEDLGYRLSYPAICNIASTNVNDRVDFICNWQGDTTWPRFIIVHHDSDFYRPPSGISVVEWVKKSPELDLGSAVKIDDLETVHFTRKQTHQVDGSDYYYFINGGQLYEISIINVDGKEDKQLYDRFLSSFHFEK